MNFIEKGEIEFLFLGKIYEPDENKLKIVVHPPEFDNEIKPILFGETKSGITPLSAKIILSMSFPPMNRV